MSDPEPSSAPVRHRLTFHPDVAGDIAHLADYGVAVLDLVTAVLEDLAHGRVTGKQLGERRVSGDLTGLARVKFDLPGQRPQRFRLLYRPADSDTYDVVAVGLRDQHAIYRAVVRRLSS